MRSCNGAVLFFFVKCLNPRLGDGWRKEVQRCFPCREEEAERFCFSPLGRKVEMNNDFSCPADEGSVFELK